MRKDKFCLIVPVIIISIIFSVVIANATTYTISGIVFDDKNCNSQRNAVDGGIGGVTITLFPGNITTSTLPDGTYSLSGLEEGIYTVMEAVPTGYCNTTPNSRTIKIKNKSITNQNFGNSKLISNIPCEQCSPIQIQFPYNGATIDKPTTIIKGIVKTSGLEVGVVVNGVVAQVVGNEFVANHVALTEGWNTITAEATGADGSKTSTSIQINCQPGTEYINLTSDKESGISPLDITLMVDTCLQNSIDNVSLTSSGPATPVITTISDTEYNAVMTVDGIYTYTITITDNNGNKYEDSIQVSVVSMDKIDPLLKGKWEGMKSALVSEDINGAIGFFEGASQDIYRDQFAALKPILNLIANEISQVNLIKVEDNIAEYEIITTRDGETYSFSLLFMRDKDGLWKIKSF